MQFYAFDVLMSEGDDLRKLSLSMRKASLAQLLARRIDGMFLSDYLRCPKCNGWVDTTDLGAVLDHAGPLPHPAIDQPQ